MVLKNRIQNLIFFVIGLTPIFGFGEVLSFIGYKFDNLIYFKLPKDILIVLITILSCIQAIKTRINFELRLLFFVNVFFTIIVFILSSTNFNIAVSGLRWSLPFFLIFLFINIVDKTFLNRISKLLSFLIILNFLVQIYEMFNSLAFRGINFLGLAGRLSGFFASPSIAGAFGGFCYFFIKYFSSFEKKKQNLMMIIAVLSVFLSMSSTGVGLILVLLVIPAFNRFKRHYFILFIAIFIPILMLGFLNLDYLTGRVEGSSFSSLNTRFDIFYRNFFDSEYISTQFGSATNTAMNILRKENSEVIITDAFIADSLFTSILVNYGMLFFLLYCLFIISIIIRIMKTNREVEQGFVLLSFLSSISLIVTEIFPINIFIAILAAYFIKNDYNKT